MDKKAIALGGLSALLLASTSSGDAAAQQKLIAPSTNIPKMTVSPSPNNASRAIDTQRSKSINQASPAAANKLTEKWRLAGPFFGKVGSSSFLGNKPDR